MKTLAREFFRKIKFPHFNKPLLVIALCITAYTGKAQSQGPNNPGTGSESQFACLSCPGAQWIGFNYIKAADDSFATTRLDSFGYCFQTQCYKSRGLEGNSYGFTIPLTATITGIEVGIKRKASIAAAVLDTLIELMSSYAAVPGINHASAAFWPISNQAVAYGGPGDLWGSNWTAAQIDSAGFGVYLEVANHHNTMDTASVDNINVTVYYSVSTPPTAAFGVNDSVLCTGDSVQFTNLSSPSTAMVTWSFPGGTPVTSSAQNPNVTYSNPGQYSVTLVVTDSSGADTVIKANYVVVDSLPSTPLIILSRDTLTSSSATGNQWYLNDTLIPGAIGIQYIATQSGSYTVVVTNSGNCTAISVPQQYIASGIALVSGNPALFTVMPNPSKGDCVIHFITGNDAQAIMRITDISGKTVELRNLSATAGENICHLGIVNKIPAGIYMIELEANQVVWRQKLVIEE